MDNAMLNALLEGALLVVRSDVDPADWLFGIVGQNGIEPNEFYIARGGILVRCPSSD